MKIDAVFFYYLLLLLFFMNNIDAMLLKMWHSMYNDYTIRKFDRKNEERERI